MNNTRQTPKQQQLHESTAGEEDPGAGLDSEESAIKPLGHVPGADRPAAPVPPPRDPGQRRET